MASNLSIDLIPSQSLTDCTYFVNGINCKYGDLCRFRHCRQAIQQTQQCFKWPNSCNNVKCRYRHPSVLSKASSSSYLPSPRFTMMPFSSQLQEQQQKSQQGIISIFWDLENVQIPRTQKPFDIVQRIRQMLVITPGLREIGFTCYCDVATISQSNQVSLTHANVRIAHVPDRKPGGVDRQILLDLDRFERAHRPPATIVLISGDIDFVGKLSDLRHQAHFQVIVVHNKPAKEELKATVNAHYSWDIFTCTNQSASTIDALAGLQISSSPGSPPSNQIRHPSSSNSFHSRAQHPTSHAPMKAKNLSRCPKCTSEFDTENSLHQHQEAKQHLFDCSSCDERFFTLAAQRQHQKDKKHHRPGEYSCTDCKKSFGTLKSLEQHQNATGHDDALSSSSSSSNYSDINSMAFYCPQCNIHYEGFGTLEEHIKIHLF